MEPILNAALPRTARRLPTPGSPHRNHGRTRRRAKKEATEWHRVVFYGKLGEIAGEYLKKGSLVRVEGRIRTRKWQDKEGQDRYSTDIEGTDMLMLPNGKSKGDAAEKPQRSKPEGVPASSSNRFNDSDDGPF